MGLSHDIISEFVKITNDNKEKPKEGIVYATIVQTSDGKYVKIDGSDLLTPTDTTTDIEDGERVTVMIKDHKATVTGNVTAPSASGNRVDKVVETVTEQIGVFETVVADKVSTNELEAYKITVDTLIAGKAEIEDLEATNAVIENLKVKDAEIENLVADKATIEDLEAVNATIENLKVKDAEIENAVIGNLEATKAEIGILEADFAQIKTLVSGNLTSDNILSFNITADKVTMEDAFIKDAMIDTVNASKINAGKINTNSVSIGSEDGGMLITGATQQFTDKNGNVRIQIGRDTSGDFTFALYGEDGQGQLINQNGITASAIADGLIVNDMVSDNAAISGGKLDISSVVTEINNDNTTTIKSNKIYLDEQNQSLEVAFKSLKTQVDTIKDIDSDLTTITDKIQSNTSKIEANKSSISTLLAEDAAIKKQVTDLEGNVVETTNTLTSKYTSLQQNLDGFKTTVNNTYATKTSVNDVKNNLSSNYSTTSAMNSAIEQKVDEISASVSSTYATKNEVKTIDDNIKANYSTTEQMESAISVAKDEINLGISKVYETKTNVESKISSSASSTLTNAKSYADTKKSEAISTASSDATSKANNALTSAKSYTDTAKNALNTEIGKKANSTDVYTKTQTYTKTEVDSAIKLSKDTIELGVSQKYETKEEVTNKVVDAVNNIKVGGRNYLFNSNFTKTTTLNGVTNKNPNLYPADWSGYNGGISNPSTNYHAHIDKDTFGYNVVEYNETDGTRHWKGINQGNLQNRIKNVGEFTISMDVYATMSGTKTWGGFYYTKVGGTTQSFHSGSFTINSDKISVGKWTRVTTKVPMNSDVDFNKDITFYIYGYGFTSNAILYIKNVTLSQGTTGLDWCPAPEEVDSEISSAKSNAITESKNYTDSQIKISKDAIELGVSQKYETKSNVTSQVSTALTSAKSYADTKKSEAISTASSDATTKANNALTSAKSYADTKKSEAITSANNTLNSTIANYYTKTQTDSQIKIAKDAINLGVSETYETKTNVTSKVNSAISTASSDATTKANNALSSAKSYADTKKSEAITSASNTLNTTIANYYTKTQTDSAIKLAKDSVTTQVGKVEEIASSSLQGKMLYTDPTFESGNNSMNMYNNAGNGTVTVTRITKSSDCPTTSGYMMQIKTTGTASPGHGGFYFATQTRNNAIFVTKIIAKIPTNYTLIFATNDIGTGGSHKWLTDNKGTGNWKEYIYKVTCGNGGTLSSTNFFYVSGGSTATTSAPVTWYVAMATTFDITATDNIEKRMNTAEQKITSTAITNTVKQNFYTKTETDGKVTTVQNNMQSSITQLSNQIATKVDVNGVLSTIQQNPNSIQIGFNKISNALTIDSTGMIAKAQNGNKYYQLGYNGITMYNPANGTHEWGRISAINSKFTVASNGNSSGLSLGHFVSGSYVEDILCSSTGVVHIQRQMNHNGILYNNYGHIIVRQSGQGGWEITGRSDSQAIKPGGSNQGAIGSNTQYINQSWIANRYNPSSLKLKHLSHYIDDLECLKLVNDVKPARYFYKEYNENGDDVTTFTSRTSQLGLIYEDVRACSGRDLITNEEDAAINLYGMVSVLWGAVRNLNNRLNNVEYENVTLKNELEEVKNMLNKS